MIPDTRSSHHRKRLLSQYLPTHVFPEKLGWALPKVPEIWRLWKTRFHNLS